MIVKDEFGFVYPHADGGMEVRTYYKIVFPSDDLGDELPNRLTFSGFAKRFAAGKTITVHHVCAFLPGENGHTCFRSFVFLVGADFPAGHVDEWDAVMLNLWETGLLVAVILLGRPWSQIELAFIGLVLAAYLAIKEWRR